MRESPLMKIWGGGNKLVGLEMCQPTAANPTPTRFEEEILRIFQEHQKFEAENGRLKEYQTDIENREGACCPEDVGFDEYIKRLKIELEQLKEKLVAEYERGVKDGLLAATHLVDELD